MLAWLLVGQLALESTPSVRCLYRQFLSKQTDASLNSYYRALSNGLVTDASIRQALAEYVLAMIPEALRQESVFLSVDDTTIAKWGKYFDGVAILYDRARHDDQPFVNGHAFVSLTMSVAWQESRALRGASSETMAAYPLCFYRLRWGIETNYYEQKMFWELGSYKVRRSCGTSWVSRFRRKYFSPFWCPRH